MGKPKKSLKKILKPITDAVKQDDYDKLMYKDLFKSQKKLKKEEEDLKKFYPPIDDLNRDVYTSLYKYKPEFTDPAIIKNSHKLNASIMESLSQAKKYDELRENTKLDPVLSMMGTANLQEEVKKVLEEKKDDVEELQQQIADAQAAVDKAIKDANAPKGPADASQQGSGEGQGDGSDKLTLAEAKKRLEEALAAGDDFVAKEFKRSKVNSMVQNVTQEINEISEMISNWGLDQTSEYRYSGHEEKLALLDEIRNSRKLREIAKFLGRLKMLKFKEGRDKVKKGFEDISDIVVSNKIDRMLVSEYNSLLDEDLQLIFLQKFIDKKLLTYQLRGKTKNEVGPIIVCIDSSGSMSGDSEIWAKGLAMGVLETARNQKRDLYVIHFSDGRAASQLHVNNFEKANHHNGREILDFANYFEGGGTMFHPALDLSREKIGSDEKFSKADILFISDGQSAITDSWLKEFMIWKEKNKVNITSILINGWGYSSDGTLKEFSDKVHQLSDVMSDSGIGTAVDIIGSL